MGSIASQITSLTIVYSIVYSDADQSKHQRSTSLASVRGPVNSLHKWPVTRKMLPFDDIIMISRLPFTWNIMGTIIITRRSNETSVKLLHFKQKFITTKTEEYVSHEIWFVHYTKFRREISIGDLIFLNSKTVLILRLVPGPSPTYPCYTCRSANWNSLQHGVSHNGAWTKCPLCCRRQFQMRFREPPKVY